MPQHSRRAALKIAGVSALSLALAQIGLTDEVTDSQATTMGKWIEQLQDNALQLRHRKINPLLWQEGMDNIYRSTPMDSLKEHLNFKSLSKSILEKMPADRGEYFHTIRLNAPESTEASASPEPRQVLITKVARVRNGYSVPPHGHSNMVSAFLCLSGEFDVRLYDRLEERADSMVVRSTVHQKSAGPGTWSSISDYRDNVHWLTAKSDDCFLFTCKMLSVEEGLPLNGRINIDLKQAKQLNTTTFLASKITSEEARLLY